MSDYVNYFKDAAIVYHLKETSFYFMNSFCMSSAALDYVGTCIPMYITILCILVFLTIYLMHLFCVLMLCHNLIVIQYFVVITESIILVYLCYFKIMYIFGRK